MKKNILLLAGLFCLFSAANAEVCGRIVKSSYSHKQSEVTFEFSNGRMLSSIISISSMISKWPTLSTAIANELNVCFDNPQDKNGIPTRELEIVSISK